MRQIVAPDRKQFPIAVFISIQAADIKQTGQSKTSLSNGSEKAKPRIINENAASTYVIKVLNRCHLVFSLHRFSSVRLKVE